MSFSNRFRCGVWLTTAAIALVGCGPSEVAFRGNLPFVQKFSLKKSEGEKDDEYRERVQARERNLQDTSNVLAAFFGTPDNPELPPLTVQDLIDNSEPADSDKLPPLTDAHLKAVLDIEKIKMSAGAVKSDKSGNPVGLYREHCVHCHGITGDGQGPTAAFLNPYPRDYRLGTFKFKATRKGFRPTHEDLTRILMEGVPGTAMPSFNVLDKDEVESLVHYVRYLAVRGEVERALVSEIANELGEKDRLVDPANVAESSKRVIAIASRVVKKWVDAERSAWLDETGENFVKVEPRPAEWDTNPEALKAARARGRELFYGKIANCVKCHGDSALGDGQTTDFDDWSIDLGAKTEDKGRAAVEAGALPPRNIRPRNLRLGNYRGGRRPIDLYWRIVHGIDGTPMPAVPRKSAQNALGLDNEEIWCLVEYVRYLPYETMSQLEKHQPTNVRDRN